MKAQTTEQNDIFNKRLQQPDIVAAFFFPLSHAAWHDGYYSLNKDDIPNVRTKLSGVRFQAADPSNLEPERQCQQDVLNLIQSLNRLRQIPALSNLVLSPDILTTSQSDSGTRVKFGLYLNPKGRFSKPTDAARVCHRRIVRAIKKSGFVIDAPKTFNPKTGMDGLSQWAEKLRLRPRRKLWPWLLLLLLLLPFLKNCNTPPEIFVPIETQSFIIIMDKSSSMAPHFQAVRTEAGKTLERMKSSFFSTHYANIIAYHSSAISALGAIKKVNDESGQKLILFLDNLKPDGGTNLRSGIEMAAKEVAAHKKPTTLLIFTDGEDSSIEAMLQDMKPIITQFQDIQIIGNTLTPRLFSDGADPTPLDNAETKLKELAKALNGQFGPIK